ncbi:hypothetical protein PIB30_052823 [Stylosanthes scabra]|uniref:Uncharacterized protein n=1 Tax=Stylosanthes scabra TaxID=79078 RepID=A0ABU6ZH58_9FABA|nr:hypothetical protein [Stylosanthes scabra]
MDDGNRGHLVAAVSREWHWASRRFKDDNEDISRSDMADGYTAEAAVAERLYCNRERRPPSLARKRWRTTQQWQRNGPSFSPTGDDDTVLLGCGRGRPSRSSGNGPTVRMETAVASKQEGTAGLKGRVETGIRYGALGSDRNVKNKLLLLLLALPEITIITSSRFFSNIKLAHSPPLGRSSHHHLLPSFSSFLVKMGNGVIYYQYEKREKLEDYDLKADAELGTFKIKRYHLDDEASVHPLRSVRIDPDLSVRDSVRGIEGAKELGTRFAILRLHG